MPSSTEIRIGGLSRLSTCDWPGQLAATVFCQGCPWDCAYCHNPQLLPGKADAALPWSEVLQFLQRRRGLLDAVVFSGGEPTLQTALPRAIEAVRAMGYRVGLHTGGAYPQRLASILPLLDWVGFDVKAPFEDYQRITGVADSGARALQSLRHLLGSGVAYQLRTTVHPALLSADDLANLAAQLGRLGVRDHTIQPFRALGSRLDRIRPHYAEQPALARQ
ncbi:anaerobic ribonucleoside-triphosphate reductase activating protein [Rhodopseudomonas palustris]|uniref:Ribonucleoside-triphosphate reductase, anaerobic-like n=1 Tax=Rhodopseudomonas palustris (strain BisB18) TaxID=316056 RepID=Q210Y1_RHOPB